MAVIASKKGLELLMSNMAEIKPGEWVPAKPLPGPLRGRLRDAWAVLWGRAEALYFKGQR